jgi:hypothetical protein
MERPGHALRSTNLPQVRTRSEANGYFGVLELAPDHEGSDHAGNAFDAEAPGCGTKGYRKLPRSSSGFTGHPTASSSDEQDWAPRYNIAPTQAVPVVRQHSNEPVRKLSLMKWG